MTSTASLIRQGYRVVTVYESETDLMRALAMARTTEEDIILPDDELDPEEEGGPDVANDEVAS